MVIVVREVLGWNQQLTEQGSTSQTNERIYRLVLLLLTTDVEAVLGTTHQQDSQPARNEDDVGRDWRLLRVVREPGLTANQQQHNNKTLAHEEIVVQPRNS